MTFLYNLKNHKIINKRMTFNLGKNSQLIHIIAESVILIGLTFYFVSRNNKLNKSIQLTSKKLSDLEDKVNRQDILINQLLRVINNLPVQKPNPNLNSPSNFNQSMAHTNVQGSRVFNGPVDGVNTMETESNLDQELEAELAELDEPIEIENLQSSKNSSSLSEDIDQLSNSSHELIENVFNNDLKHESPSNRSDFSIEND